MINPVVAENALRVYFPSVEPTETSVHTRVSYPIFTCGDEITSVAANLVRVAVDSCPGVTLIGGGEVGVEDSKFRKASHNPEVVFSGDYVGLKNIGLPRFKQGLKGYCTPSLRKGHLYDVRSHYVVDNLFAGLDSSEVQAELHLFKMQVFEALESRRRALDYMYDFLEDAFSQKDISMINHMLFLASTSLVGHSLSVSFLRATSRARKQLTFWRLFESRVRSSLKDNPNAKKLLKGLD